MEQVPDQGWRVSRILLAATAVVALFLCLAIPTSASLTATVSLHGAAAATPEPPLEQSVDTANPDDTDDGALVRDDLADLRELPLLPADSTVREQFQTMSDTQDPEQVEAIGELLAVSAGIGKKTYLALESILPEVQYPESSAYPYTMPALEELLSESLAVDNTDIHGGELLEFASFSTLRAAWAARDPESRSNDHHGWISYAILQALPESCDRDLSVAHLATMGQSRVLDSTGTSIRRAITSCPDDPTPKYLYGMWLADRSADFGTVFWNPPWDSAVSYFKEWQDNDPSSSLAHAGAAHAMLRLIIAAQASGALPLTARELRSQALTHISAAITLNPDPVHYAASAVISELMGDPLAADRSLKLAKDAPQAEFARSYIHHLRGEFSEVGALTPDHLDTNPVQSTALGPWIAALVPGSPLAMAAEVEDPGLHDTGASSLDWFGTIPEFRGSYRELHECPVAWEKWNALLAGNHADAARETTIGEPSLRLSRCFEVEGDAIVSLETTATEAITGAPTSYDYDKWQNYHRLAGDLTGAETVIERWVSDYPEDVLALSMRAEVLFLKGDFDGAATDFEDVLSASTTFGIDQPCIYESTLNLGISLGETETRKSEAIDVFNQARGMSDEEKRCSGLAGVDAYISLRIAADLATAGSRGEAIEHFETAIDLFNGEDSEDVVRAQALRALINQTYATWLVEWGADPERAIHLAQEALTFDPLNPVFWDTLGQAHQQAGNTKEAENAYAMATAGNTVDDSDTATPTDPAGTETGEDTEQPTTTSVTPFQSLNNLAVLRFDRGDREGAAEALAAALREKPDYAVGWWNLGILESASLDPSHFNRSEGALSQAVRLDPSFRGKALDLVIDYEIFDANLDLSRTVDQSWSIGRSARPVGSQLSWVAVALAVLAVAGNLLREQSINVSSEWLLKRRKSRGLFLPVLIYGALLAGLVVYTIESSASGWVAGGLVALAMAAIVTLYTVVAGPFAQVRGWTPAVALSVVLVALHIPFLPAPVVNNPEVSPRRWPGVVILGGTAVVGLLLSVATGSPTLRLIGLTALALTGSAMLPLPPFDGAAMKHRALKATTSMALLGTAVATSMSWI